MKRIGLFGGSFDPVHLGHLLVAQAACEELALDRLFFIPAAQSPFKPASEPTPANLRLRMLRLALAGKTHYEIDPQETERGGISFSIDTVRDYARRFPQAELFYLIGADHAPTLPKWRDAEELARLVEFVVIARPGEVPADLGTQNPERRGPSCANAPDAPRRMDSCAPSSAFRVRALVGWPLQLSSSQIRARVKAGQPIDDLVPPAVNEMILLEGLYRI